MPPEPQQAQNNPTLTPTEAAITMQKISDDNHLGLKFEVVDANGRAVVQAKLNKDLSRNLDNSYANGGPAVSEVLPPKFVIGDVAKSGGGLLGGIKDRAVGGVRGAVHIGGDTGAGVGGAGGGVGGGISAGETISVADVGMVVPKPGTEHVIRTLPTALTNNDMGHFANMAPVLKDIEDGKFPEALATLKGLTPAAPPAPGVKAAPDTPAQAGGNDPEAAALSTNHLQFQANGEKLVAQITDPVKASNLEAVLKNGIDKKDLLGSGAEKFHITYERDEKNVVVAAKITLDKGDLSPKEVADYQKHAVAMNAALDTGDPVKVKTQLALNVTPGNSELVGSIHTLPNIQQAKSQVLGG